MCGGTDGGHGGVAECVGGGGADAARGAARACGSPGASPGSMHRMEKLTGVSLS